MLNAPHYSAAGSKHGEAFALPAELFDGTVNEPVLHQAVRAYLNNQRQGTAATKTRGFVSGGNQKPWRQKGTGRARQGSTRAPHWPGGGTVFGPSPRDYTTAVPKKVKQLARKSALNARAREGRLHVVERVALAAPKTSALAGLLGALGLAGQNVLVLTNGYHPAAYLSGRNLPSVKVQAYHEVTAYDLLWSEAVVVEEGALTGAEPTPVTESAAVAAPKAKKAPARKQASAEAAEKPAKKAAAKKATKAAAKKPAAKKPKGE